MDYSILAPENGSLDRLLATPALPAFHDKVISFIDTLSQEILLEKKYRIYPELIAMAFWMRKANLLELQSHFLSRQAASTWVARGLAFHIAPSNVDTIFIYSWFLSMLCGNSNIIRVSSSRSEQVNLLLSAINNLLGEQIYVEIKDRFLIVTYEHDEELTRLFSSHCDVRLIWGGDATISNIRRAPLPPTSTELTFADKFSFALIDADAWLSLTDSEADRQINNFYNDAYWYGQMACSSPRLVAWKGNRDTIRQAREDFWRRLREKVAKESPDISAADCINKLVATRRFAIEAKVTFEADQDNLLTVLWLDNLDNVPLHLHCGSGLFLETGIEELSDLKPILSRKIQTVSIFGIGPDEIKEFVANQRPEGIDRFVHFGKALEFSPVWDGYHMLSALTREVSIL